MPRRKRDEDVVAEDAVVEDADRDDNFVLTADADLVQSEEQREVNQDPPELEVDTDGPEGTGDFEPDDPHDGAGASPENIEEILPSEGDYSGVRDPNYQFQERGKERLVEGDAVPIPESNTSADGAS